MKNRKMVKLLTVASLCVVILAAILGLTACSSGPKYKLMFYFDNNFYYGVETDGQSKVSLPHNPDKDPRDNDKDFPAGYTIGWFLDKDCTQRFKEGTLVDNPIDKDTNLYGKLVERELTLKFMVGDDVYHSLVFNGAVDVELPANPSAPEGKVFSGWYRDANFETSLDKKPFSKLPATDDYCLYAKIIDKNFTLEFKYNGKVVSTKEHFKGDEPLVLPAAPEVAQGKIFVGWYLDNAKWQKPVTENTFVENPIVDNATIYAYVRNKITVNFMVGSTAVGKMENFNGVSALTMPADPTVAADEVFLGWYLNSQGTGDKVTANYYVEKNADSKATTINIYGIVVKKDFTVEFVVDGKSVDSLKIEHFTGDAAIAVPAAPEVAEGKVFEGWYLDSKFETELTADSFVNNPVYKNIKIYAKIVDAPAAE